MRKRSPRKSRDETGTDNVARCARPARLAVRLLRQNPRKLYGKPALVSSLSRLARLLGGGRRPERTGLVPSMRLLPLVGRSGAWRGRPPALRAMSDLRHLILGTRHADGAASL